MQNSSLSSGTTTELIDYLSKYPPQRVNRFNVAFNGGYFTTTGGGEKDTGFFATMVQLPSRGIMFYPDSVGPWSPQWRVPLKTTFDDKFIVEFLVDESFAIRKFIENWMVDIYNQGNGRQLKDLSGGKNPCSDTRMIITPVKSTNSPSGTTITLDYVWPKLILPSEFNSDRPDLLRLQVDFSYRTAVFS